MTPGSYAHGSRFAAGTHTYMKRAIQNASTSMSDREALQEDVHSLSSIESNFPQEDWLPSNMDVYAGLASGVARIHHIHTYMMT